MKEIGSGNQRTTAEGEEHVLLSLFCRRMSHCTVCTASANNTTHSKSNGNGGGENVNNSSGGGGAAATFSF